MPSDLVSLESRVFRDTQATEGTDCRPLSSANLCQTEATLHRKDVEHKRKGSLLAYPHSDFLLLFFQGSIFLELALVGVKPGMLKLI